MTTFQEVITDARLTLMTNTVEKVGILDATIDNDDTTLTLDFDMQGIAEGTILGIELEELYVLSKAGTILTVIRGWNNSPAVGHTVGVPIRINAKFTDYRLAKYVNDCLEDMSGEGLFRMRSIDFTYNPSQTAYDVNAADLIDIWRVRYDIPGPTMEWKEITKNMWELDQAADTTDFPNGKAILLQTGGFPGHKVRVSYKASFAPLVNGTDNVESVAGLHLEAHSLLSMGAAINAVVGREVKRTFLERQTEPRRAEEVPVGGASQAMLPLLKSYAGKLRKERRRLRRKFPDRVF